MSYLNTPEDQVRILALLARMAIKLGMEAGVTEQGDLCMRLGPGVCPAWKVDPSHRPLLGGLPTLPPLGFEAAYAEAAMRTVEDTMPMPSAWMQSCLAALGESGTPPTAYFAALEALEVWRAFGHCEPRAAVQSFWQEQAGRQRFVRELCAALAADPSRGEQDAEDIGGTARSVADSPLHLVLDARQYLQLTEQAPRSTEEAAAAHPA